MSQEIDNTKKHGGGPKTPEGKQRSSLNATRHGLLARAVVLPTEKAEAFHELLNDYIRDFAPQTRFEQDLVEELAATRWRLQRIWAMENTAIQIGMKRTEQAARAEFGDELAGNVVTTLAFIEMSGETRALQLLNRYESRLNKRFHQIQVELKAIAKTRNDEAKAASAEAKKSLPNELPQPRPIRPIDDKTPPSPIKIPPKQEDAA
jgi:hypothetical protein